MLEIRLSLGVNTRHRRQYLSRCHSKPGEMSTLENKAQSIYSLNTSPLKGTTVFYSNDFFFFMEWTQLFWADRKVALVAFD